MCDLLTNHSLPKSLVCTVEGTPEPGPLEKKITHGSARSLIHPSAWRNCLIIPEEAHCGPSREPQTMPETPVWAPFVLWNEGARGCQSDLSDSFWKGYS